MKALHFLCFIVSVILAISVGLIEWQIISAMSNFEEPTYNFSNFILKGVDADLAHILNFILIFIAVLSAAYFYNQYRKG